MVFVVVVLHFCCFKFGKAEVWNYSDSFYEAPIRPLTWQLWLEVIHITLYFKKKVMHYFPYCCLFSRMRLMCRAAVSTEGWWTSPWRPLWSSKKRYTHYITLASTQCIYTNPYHNMKDLSVIVPQTWEPSSQRSSDKVPALGLCWVCASSSHSCHFVAPSIPPEVLAQAAVLVPSPTWMSCETARRKWNIWLSIHPSWR